jgi:putative transposase
MALLKGDTMPRPKLIRSDKHPYHITARTNNKEHFPIALNQVWYIMNQKLHRAQEKQNLCIHNFVLMKNHFHLICTTPEENLDEIMRDFMRETSKEISFQAKKIGSLYGGPYHWSLITSDRYYAHAYRYVYLNPVRAGLCKKVEHYPYSSIHRKDVPYNLTTWLPIKLGGSHAELSWLNKNYDEEETITIKAALRRREFEFKPNSMTRRIPQALLSNIY